MTKIGSRVGALVSSKNGISIFLGFGAYVGDEVPEPAVGWMADALRELKVPNPKLVMDDGTVVFGCECWWGSAGKVWAMLKASKFVIHKPIELARKEVIS